MRNSNLTDFRDEEFGDWETYIKAPTLAGAKKVPRIANLSIEP